MLSDSQAAGTAASSMVSDALLRISERANDEHDAALLEKAVKETSAAAYGGSCSASNPCLFDIYLIILFILFMLLAASETVYWKLCLILFPADERYRRCRLYVYSCLPWSSTLRFKHVLKKKLTPSLEKVSNDCLSGMTALPCPTLMPF